MSKIYLAVTAGSVHYKNALDGILELNGGGAMPLYLADANPNRFSDAIMGGKVSS